MSALERFTVDLHADDPRFVVFLDPEDRPDVLTAPAEIVLIPYEARLVRDLLPGKSVPVVDRLGDRVLLVMADDEPGVYTAAEIPEATEVLARHLRA